jgi:hypothetical protein
MDGRTGIGQGNESEHEGRQPGMRSFVEDRGSAQRVAIRELIPDFGFLDQY